ncbi:MAG: hypothetical protein U0797_29760 [Gemmataceae bacterium]
MPLRRDRAGLPDHLLQRTLAALHFLSEPSLSTASGALFRESAILLQLGWAQRKSAKATTAVIATRRAASLSRYHATLTPWATPCGGSTSKPG